MILRGRSMQGHRRRPELRRRREVLAQNRPAWAAGQTIEQSAVPVSRVMCQYDPDLPRPGRSRTAAAVFVSLLNNSAGD
jgi:hypothetical protein